MSESVENRLEGLIWIKKLFRQTEHAVFKLTQIEQVFNKGLKQLKLTLHKQCISLRLG